MLGKQGYQALCDIKKWGLFDFYKLTPGGKFTERKVIIMIRRNIRLSRERVSKFVKAACDCQAEIDICYDRIIVNAKSILGVYSLDLSRVLTVMYPEDEKVTSEFEHLLNSYAVIA